MDLSIFFDPFSLSGITKPAGSNNLYTHLNLGDDYKPDWKNAHIALIGLTEHRGSLTNSGSAQAADAVRKEFYSLYKSNNSFKICDLGNLRNGVDLAETYHKIKVVTEILLEHNVLPIFIGGTHDLCFGMYAAYQEKERLISFLTIDAEFDMQNNTTNGANKQHIQKILLHEPNFLLNYSHIAYQSYLNHPESIKTLEKLNFDVLRLGMLRDDIAQAEPLIRDADCIGFDMAAIRSTEAPGTESANPFGLTAEEACQLCWYAGASAKLSAIGFYEYNPELDERNRTAKLEAVMLWYFVEGYYHRHKESDYESADYYKYIVDLKNDPHHIVFYKSKKSDKWWMEVPVTSGKYQMKYLHLPCSYRDYKQCLEGEIPNRWILAHARVS